MAEAASAPRVLHLFRSMEPEHGGPLAYLESLYDSLRDSGLRMDYACALYGPPVPTLPPALHKGVQGARQFANAWRFFWWLRRELKPGDVVHLHNTFAWHFVIGAALCRWRGIPYVVSSHGLISDWFLQMKSRWKGFYLAVCGKPLIRAAAVVLTMTPREQRIHEQYDARFKVRLIPSGVPLPPRETPDAVYHDERSHSRLNVLFVGRLSSVKGLSDLLPAIAELQREGRAIHLDVVGGESRDYGSARLKREIAENHIGEIVTYHGFTVGAAKEKLLRQAHVVALPSLSENFSFITAEALAAGLPVVLTSSVGLADLVRDHGCGTVVPPANARELAAALRRYFDPALRAEQGRKARDCAERELSLQVMGERMLKLYREVAASAA